MGAAPLDGRPSGRPDAGAGLPPRGAGGFGALSGAYVSWLGDVRGLSANTCRAYAEDLAAFGSWSARAGIDPLAVTHSGLRAYLADLARARYATTTINRRLSAIRGFFGWAAREGVPNAAAEAVASPKLSRRLPRTMSDEEACRLIEACAGPRPEDARDRALMELLYATGARISEASALDVGSVDFGAGQVRLFGKGSKERLVPVYPAALDAVAAYAGSAREALLAKAAAPSGDARRALFISTRGGRMSADSLRRAFERRRAAAGLDPQITPHAMRHTFATELLTGGADLRSVQELLGHESLSTTTVYTHLSVERLKDAARAAHPRA